MPGAMLPLLAHIEERDLAATAEPLPQGRDIDGCSLQNFRSLPPFY
jgi:hypothetical protein